MNQIIAFGSEKFCLGFTLAGITPLVITNESELHKQVQNLINSKQKSIIITEEENIEQLPCSLKQKVRESMAPLFIPVGAKQDKSELRALIKKSIGVDLLGEEN